MDQVVKDWIPCWVEGNLVRILFTLGTKQREYDTSKVLGVYREAQLQVA